MRMKELLRRSTYNSIGVYTTCNDLHWYFCNYSRSESQGRMTIQIARATDWAAGWMKWELEPHAKRACAATSFSQRSASANLCAQLDYDVIHMDGNKHECMGGMWLSIIIFVLLWDPCFDLISYQLSNSKHVLVGLVTYTSEFRGADLALWHQWRRHEVLLGVESQYRGASALPRHWAKCACLNALAYTV